MAKIEKDGKYFFMDGDRFLDHDKLKWHTVVISLDDNTAMMQYCHYTDDDYHFATGVVFKDTFENIFKGEIQDLCGHWSLYSLKEQFNITCLLSELRIFIKRGVHYEEV